MSKNNKFIEYMKILSAINHNERVEEAAKQDTVQIYSVLAMALFDLLDGDDKEKTDSINTIFARSQEIWLDCVDKNIDVVEECEKLTGITMRYKDKLSEDYNDGF